MTTIMRHRMWLTVLAMAALLALLLMPKITHGEEYWLTALTNEVRSFQEKSGDFDVYLDQLKVVRQALLKRDDTAVYAAMNRFMDMLENRENGIAAPVADWLFHYCNVVTPTRYHDISRHIRKTG